MVPRMFIWIILGHSLGDLGFGSLPPLASVKTLQRRIHQNYRTKNTNKNPLPQPRPERKRTIVHNVQNWHFNVISGIFVASLFLGLGRRRGFLHFFGNSGGFLVHELAREGSDPRPAEGGAPGTVPLQNPKIISQKASLRNAERTYVKSTVAMHMLNHQQCYCCAQWKHQMARIYHCMECRNGKDHARLGPAK